MRKVVIIGGGLAGLSAGYHLRDHEPIVFEKEADLGGLCRSFRQDGFTFDCTGHLIHLRQPYTKELVAELLPDALTPHERRSVIYSNQRTTPYPFQANTYGLPPEVIRDCVLGFIETLHAQPNGDARTFHEWIHRTFGSGIAKHFMLPFNEKFWRADLRTMTADWVSWSIPKPGIEEVINGALGLTNKGMGYNPRFLYPKDGGIECLPLALARPLNRVRRSMTVQSIDSARKVVRFAGGQEESYDHLITTLPLPVTFSLLIDAPDDLRCHALNLRVLSVLNFNVGIDRPRISDAHWIYFPEEEYVFSRIGFPANFSEAVAPPNASSMYIEITHRPDEKVHVEALFDRALAGLRRAGILQHGDSILTRQDLDLRFAYVVFDEHRQRRLAELIQYLESVGIQTAGRFGRWDYFSMEDSILSGKAAADSLRPQL